MSATARASALLAELTLEEKVAQLGSVWLTDTAGDFAPAVDASSEPDAEGDRLDGRLGLGQLTRPYGTDPLAVADGAARLAALQERVVASSRLGIPALVHEECLTGFAAFGATAYPTPLAWAATFDDELVKRMAGRIGADLRAVGVHQGLAPVLDVVRDYRWGRVEETLGEDPYLVGQLGSAYVAGLEGAGVIATLKHFAGYAASRGARNHAPVSMGPRELADVILPPFEAALRLGGARSVMNSYTDIDGVPAALDAALLGTLLRERWGFEGTVVSDYWSIPFLASMHRVARDAAHAGVLALTAGIDVELPETSSYGRSLVDAVLDGAVDEELVDRAVLRHLVHKVEAGLLDGSPLVPEGAPEVDLDSAENREVARLLAEESVILLRNDGILPLAGLRRVAVIGPCADETRSMLGGYSFLNHVLSRHPGHPPGITVATVLDATRAEWPGLRVRHERGVEVMGDDDSGIAAAVDAATRAPMAILVVGDVAGLFGGGSSGEGSDAPDLRLPGRQHELVMRVLATGIPTILVVLSGRPYALGEYEGARAIVQSFFPGAEGAAAIAGVLSGRVAPSGRLPVQIPRLPTAASTYLQPTLGLHAPGITVLDPSPLFPFGHGLTAGAIEYLRIESDLTAIDPAGRLVVKVTVANAGVEDAVETVQLYARDEVAQVVRPELELLGYARVEVPAGARRVVEFDVHADRLSFTGIDGRRIVEPGVVRLSAGPSAGHRPLGVEIEIQGSIRHIDGPRVMTTTWRVLDA